MFHKGESAEDYLEDILVLSQTLPAVRSIDIVRETGYSKPSVSIAMKNLREKNLINMDNDGYITLTDEGKTIAGNVYERHLFLSRFLMSLGVSEKTAAEDACRMEHVISEETFVSMKKHLVKHVEEMEEDLKAAAEAK